MVERDRDTKDTQKREGENTRKRDVSSAPPADATGGHLAVNEVSAATAPGQH